jgi:hypothetical protein
MVDGARNALLGYLYQLLGTASVRVREVTSAADAWALVIARFGQGSPVSEEFGQDATVHPPATPNHGVTAIQFKYSATPGSLIDRDELIDILVALDRSREEAASAGVTIEHYALVTNRQLDPRAQEIVDHAASPTPHRSLVVTMTRNGAPVAANVKRVEPHQGDPDRAAAAWHAIVRALTVFPCETFEADLHRLRQFAARYGVLDREWEACLNSLVGALVRETAQGHTVEVTREWLKEHLVGDRNAATLQFGCSFEPHISTSCCNQLDQRIKQQHRIHPDHYLERDIQQVLRSQLEQCPVVFVAGGGGRGKSLAVVNYLRSVADRQLVWSEGATTASEGGLVDVITAIRLPSHQRGGVDRSLGDICARLATANGSRRPLWTIDLDGVDEAPEQFSQIRKVINLCWARGSTAASPASVVVTCRLDTGSRTREGLISQWLDTPEPDLAPGVGYIELNDFVGDELVDAARLLNGEPEQRIIQTASLGGPGSHQHPPPVAEDILKSLRHPVVWGGYASLTEAERSGVLNRERPQLHRLAEQLHARFLRRCKTRKRWRDYRMLERALPHVARATDGHPPYTHDTWDRGCAPCLDWPEARDLYNESLSYGIIERDAARSWRWGHPFLVDYLAALGGGDEDGR